MQLIEGEISLPSKAEMEADWKRWVARNKVNITVIVLIVTSIIANIIVIVIIIILIIM